MKWYVVKNGSIVYAGTEEECIEIISKDMTGELEMYPETGKIDMETEVNEEYEKKLKETWQAINPREWGEIVQAETVTELAEIVEEIRVGKYFSDK